MQTSILAPDKDAAFFGPGARVRLGEGYAGDDSARLALRSSRQGDAGGRGAVLRVAVSEKALAALWRTRGVLAVPCCTLPANFT